ncbi:MAG TPA: hypothetical protein VGS57_05045 [Thermoanaerobaculia bacterium]|jgi:hypothetical protein|nr:hypothetical protein [Thermoanaerobaculia bacterium]
MAKKKAAKKSSAKKGGGKGKSKPKKAAAKKGAARRGAKKTATRKPAASRRGAKKGAAKKTAAKKSAAKKPAAKTTPAKRKPAKRTAGGTSSKQKALDFITKASTDHSLRQRYLADPDKTLDDAGIGAKEKAVLKSHDADKVRKYLGDDAPPGCFALVAPPGDSTS